MRARGPEPAATSRRRFLQLLGVLAVGGRTLLRSGDVRAATEEAKAALADPALPPMSHRTLGRTGFRASRLVFGCGAALSGAPNDLLLE